MGSTSSSPGRSPFSPRANIGAASTGFSAALSLSAATSTGSSAILGEAKVITAFERSLGLAEGALDHERAVLAAHGNMSAPTVLFVLKRVLDAGLPNRVLVSAMGPGFSLSSVALRSPS